MQVYIVDLDYLAQEIIELKNEELDSRKDI